jgi:hypothetical protein
VQSKFRGGHAKISVGVLEMCPGWQQKFALVCRRCVGGGTQNVDSVLEKCQGSSQKMASFCRLRVGRGTKKSASVCSKKWPGEQPKNGVSVLAKCRRWHPLNGVSVLVEFPGCQPKIASECRRRFEGVTQISASVSSSNVQSVSKCGVNAQAKSRGCHSKNRVVVFHNCPGWQPRM